MSMGYGGYADLQDFDDTLVIYMYCCYNVNNDDYKYFMDIEDGEIYIERDAFVQPEIHEKIKRTTSGRKKLIVKRVKRDISFVELFETGKIKIRNASGTWSTTESGIDTIAMRILSEIFNKYQETGDLPNHINLYG